MTTQTPQFSIDPNITLDGSLEIFDTSQPEFRGSIDLNDRSACRVRFYCTNPGMGEKRGTIEAFFHCKEDRDVLTMGFTDEDGERIGFKIGQCEALTLYQLFPSIYLYEGFARYSVLSNSETMTVAIRDGVIGFTGSFVNQQLASAKGFGGKSVAKSNRKHR